MTAYDTDYGEWLAEQTKHLKNQEWEQLDVDNIIQELYGLNRTYLRELDNYLIVLLSQMLKWEYLPLMRSGRGREQISRSRRQIYRLFKDQPSLKPYIVEVLEASYKDARDWASQGTELMVSYFPSKCPYTVEQILEGNFFPEPQIKEQNNDEEIPC